MIYVAFFHLHYLEFLFLCSVIRREICPEKAAAPQTYLEVLNLVVLPRARSCHVQMADPCVAIPRHLRAHKEKVQK